MTSNFSPRSNATQPTADEQERKRIRNRMSQRAFRRRQAEQVRELQHRAKLGNSSENEIIAALRRENRRLRAQLLEVHAKMSRVQTSTQILIDCVSQALDDPSESDNVAKSSEDQSQSRQGGSGRGRGRLSGNAAASEQVSLIEDNTVERETTVSANPFTGMNLTEGHEPPDANTFFDPTPSYGFVALPQQVPNSNSYSYHMGPQPYANAMGLSEDSSFMAGREWATSNSPFSDHIGVVQHLLKKKFDTISSLKDNCGKLMYQSISTVLSLFNSMTRPDVMIWYAKTRFYHIIELTAWELYPSISTFTKLHERYRPTEIQLREPHPRVIDWIPFPSIRDRLIQLHAANPHIDQIFCDAVSGYVVETLMSDLVLGAPPVKAYIRVTDLITSMSSPSVPVTQGQISLPVSDAAMIFKSAECARLVFQRLNMNQGASYYKIDPAFFGKYPELYSQTSDIVASGIPLKPDVQIRLSYPQPLNKTMVGTYRSFIDFSIDSVVDNFPLV